jgi:hypothetical protein
MSNETVDHQVLGIIDEQEPEAEEVPTDADYSREDKAEASESPSEDTSPEDTPAVEEATEGDDTAEASEGSPEGEKTSDTNREEEGGEGDGKSPIAFAGKEWESYDAVEQSFKSFDGRVRAAEDKATDYETRLADYYEYVQNVGKENQQLREQLNGGAQAADATPAPDQAAAPTEVDMAKILRVAKIAEERGIDPVEAALKLYHLESQSVMDNRLASMEKKLSAPMEEMESKTQEAQAERELFTWAQELKGDDGTFRYPLFQPGDNGVNEEFVGNVYQAWQALGQNYGAKYAYSQTGLDQAYRLAQEYAAQNGGMPEETAAKEPPRKSASRTLANADAEAASDLTGETPNINRPKKTAAKQALEDLGNHREVSLDGGESLGFFE